MIRKLYWLALLGFVLPWSAAMTEPPAKAPLQRTGDLREQGKTVDLWK